VEVTSEFTLLSIEAATEELEASLTSRAISTSSELFHDCSCASSALVEAQEEPAKPSTQLQTAAQEASISGHADTR
jgi:hypothetical protein